MGRDDSDEPQVWSWPAWGLFDSLCKTGKTPGPCV